MEAGRVLLMVPCYNEAKSIGPLLDEIEHENLACDVLVVDDGSDDDTHSVVAGRARCIRLATNLGIGGAVQTAARFAHEHDYDVCIQLDGDGQHPPGQVRVLLAAYRQEPADLIIGSRFLDSGGFRSSGTRRIGIAFIRVTIRLLYGQWVTDPTSGFRLLGRAAIRAFSSDYPVDFPEPISAASALSLGLRVRDIPVEMRPRAAGQSSIRGLKTAIYILRVIGYLLLMRVGRYL